VIPSYTVVPEISLPAGNDCGLPARHEISEEGFGYFRGTWWIGRVRVSDAIDAVEFEREVVAALDALAGTDRQFEALATAVEDLEPGSGLPAELRDTPIEGLLQPLAEDGHSPLGGLEIGVAGLTYAMSAVGFVTAASCRAHAGAYSWSDCPVVFFGAHKWRAVLLSELAQAAGCGIGQDRDMLTVYGPSIRNLMGLAAEVLGQRASFRTKPKSVGRSELGNVEAPFQRTLGL
jgi:hypothetical protein